MSAVSKPGLKPAKSGVASATIKSNTAASVKPSASSTGVDALDKTTAKKPVANARKVAAATAVEGIAESFPVSALSKLSAKGIEGQTFLLDGGSLRGLKLEARRIKDGETPGFEIVFQLTPSKLEPLIEAMKKQEASTGPIEFRELVVGEDGIAAYGKAKSKISGSSHNAPSDTDNKDGQWALKLDGKKGGQIEVAHDKASLAVRGLVRINLRGDDATCTKQLDGLIKSLGLASLFAPPTAKSKQVNALMRVLWQVDNAKAMELSKGDLDKLKVEDLQAALEGAGFTKERVAGLRYEEVYAGHFTVVDPGQAEAMLQAGARYLYSTVTSPEHVHSILLHGQKSSLERYKDGLIIEGMSTNSDFATGGAVGVFTRVVTQDAIYDGKSWTGRTYKLLQTHEQLGRTDWYGWNGDYFGRRWDLDSTKNFGLGLLEAISSSSGYASSNELIFTAGNRPENIQRVIATTEDARKTLIEHLTKQGYQPHNGLSLEEFVVLSPKFLPFGKAPYDASDPAKFVAEAKLLAAEGKLSPLRWFLVEGPEAKEVRQDLEKEILLGNDKKLQDALFATTKVRGGLSLGEGLDAVITELESRGAEGSPLLVRLTNEAPEALFRSGASKAVDLLISKKSSLSNYKPFGLEDEAFVRIMEALVDAPGPTSKKAFDFALDLKGRSLLSERHGGFLAFLAAHPLVKPEDPNAFIAAELAKLKQNEDSFQLELFAAQAQSPATRITLETKLLETDHQKAVPLLKTLVGKDYKLSLEADQLHGILKALPPESATRKYVLAQIPDALLKYGHQGLFELLTEHFGQSTGFGLHDEARWLSVANAVLSNASVPVSDLTRQILEHGASRLASSSEFLKKLPSLVGLYDFTVPQAFFDDAMQNLHGRGQLQLSYLFSGPESCAPHRPEGVKRLLESNDYEAKSILTRVASESPSKALPLSPAQRAQLVLDLSSNASKEPLYALLKIDGRQLLAEAAVGTLPVLDEALKGDANPLARFGLSGNTLAESLEQVRTRKDGDGKVVHAWMLKQGGPNLLDRNDPGFVGHLSNIKATLADVGIDAAGAANVIKKAVDENHYYYTHSSYESYPAYAELPLGAGWALMQGDSSPDPKVLEAIETALPSWKWDASTLAALIKRIPDLSDEWKTRLEAARTKT